MAERSANAEVAAIIARGDAEIDRVSIDLALVVSRSIERFSVAGPDGVSRLTRAGRRRVMREVDKAIEAVYGKRRGDRSRMFQLIGDRSTAGYQVGANRNIDDMRTHLADEPELMSALGGKP